MENAASVAQFVLAGNSTFTLRSVKTGTRYTYRVKKLDSAPLWFVGLLSGPDNESDFTYLGVVRDGKFSLTGKSKMRSDSKPVVAFAWTWTKLQSQVLPETVEFWHEGRCARCGRKLTVPESLETGFGPECIGRRN